MKTYKDEDNHVNSIHNSNSSHFVSMLLIRSYTNLVTSMKRKEKKTFVACYSLFKLKLNSVKVHARWKSFGYNKLGRKAHSIIDPKTERQQQQQSVF